MSIPMTVSDVAAQVMKNWNARLTGLEPLTLCPGVSLEALDDFETKAGLRIPEQLREWLMFTDGTDFESIRMISVLTRPQDMSILQYLQEYPIWKAKGWIPFATDGCGSCYVVATKVASGPPHPVGFIDHEEDMDRITYAVASDLWHFLEGSFRKTLFFDEARAKGLSWDDEEWPDFWWPFERRKMLKFDPELSKVPFKKVLL